jgi:hypothetical protein
MVKTKRTKPAERDGKLHVEATVIDPTLAEIIDLIGRVAVQIPGAISASLVVNMGDGKARMVIPVSR